MNIRFVLRALGVLFCQAVTLGGVSADERWTYLGDMQLPATRATGKISLYLDSLRGRAGHHEIWVRIVFDGAAERRSVVLSGGDEAERRTLWAIQCRRGVMAKVVEGTAGAYEPRVDSLRFYAPAPGSAGSVIIDAACAEVRRVATERRPAQSRRATAGGSVARQSLEVPPTLFGDDAFDKGDE